MPSGVYDRSKSAPRSDIVPLDIRLWNRVKKTKSCWNWTGATQGVGYGCISLKHKNLLTHRVSYEIFYGGIPNGLCVCHRCDNRLCVNPDHLFLGTIADNQRDAAAKDRLSYGDGNANSKLRQKYISFIRHSLFSGSLTGPQLARRFGVDHTTIYRAAKGITWRRA